MKVRVSNAQYETKFRLLGQVVISHLCQLPGQVCHTASYGGTLQLQLILQCVLWDGQRHWTGHDYTLWQSVVSNIRKEKSNAASPAAPSRPGKPGVDRILQC